MKELILEIKDVQPSTIFIHPEDFSAISEGSTNNVCRIIDPITMRESIAIAHIDANISKGSVASSRDLTFQLGIDDGFNCYVDIIKKDPVKLERIVLIIDSIGDSSIDLARFLSDDRDEIINNLTGKLIRKSTPFPLPDLGIVVEVSDSSPELEADDFSIFKDINDIRITQKFGSYFNGILLIDASDSMLSEKPDKTMTTIKNEEFLKQLCEIGDEVEKFINERISGRKTIRRFDAALLAILGFFRVKVAKGSGEKISIILYSEKAEAVKIKNDSGEMSSWISGGTDSEKNQRLLMSAIMSDVGRMESGQTNLDAALREAKRIADLMSEEESKDLSRAKDAEGNPIQNPLVIMLLTDGKRTVGGAPVPIARDLFKNRKKTILHTIALGDDVEEEELKEIANICRGKYHITNDAQELFMFYDKEASDFSTIKSRSVLDELLHGTKWKEV
jgi:hypothetical protein